MHNILDISPRFGRYLRIIICLNLFPWDFCRLCRLNVQNLSWQGIAPIWVKALASLSLICWRDSFRVPFVVLPESTSIGIWVVLDQLDIELSVQIPSHIAEVKKHVFQWMAIQFLDIIKQCIRPTNEVFNIRKISEIGTIVPVNLESSIAAPLDSSPPRKYCLKRTAPIASSYKFVASSSILYLIWSDSFTVETAHGTTCPMNVSVLEQRQFRKWSIEENLRWQFRKWSIKRTYAALLFAFFHRRSRF